MTFRGSVVSGMDFVSESHKLDRDLNVCFERNPSWPVSHIVVGQKSAGLELAYDWTTVLCFGLYVRRLTTSHPEETVMLLLQPILKTDVYIRVRLADGIDRS